MHNQSKPQSQVPPNSASKPILYDHSWNSQNVRNQDSSVPQSGEKSRQKNIGKSGNNENPGEPWMNGNGMFDSPDGRNSAPWLLNAPSPYRRQNVFSPLENHTRLPMDIDDDFGFESESDHAIW